MSHVLTPRPLTAAEFAPFGQVIDMAGPGQEMNGGRAVRYADLARIEIGGVHPRPILSLCRSQPVALPYALTFVERHPLGSQAFYPLGPNAFLVIVAPDHGGVPGTPLAFITAPGQGINFAMNTWHGALAPLEADSAFLIVDRGGEGNNLELHDFAEPWEVTAP